MKGWVTNMKHSKEISKIYETYDYSVFKKLVGNRPVNSHVNAIANSMKVDGWIGAPIEVNEKMEVVDGQHRLEAAKQVGIPVRYEIQNGLNLRKCQVMNNTSKGWGNNDYINSHIELGNKNYERLKTMIDKYPAIPDTVMLTVCWDGNVIASGVSNDAFRQGEFTFSESRFEEVDNILYNLSKFQHSLKCIKGRSDCKHRALHFALVHNGVDNNRLYEKISENTRRFNYVGDTVSFLEDISREYNKGLKIKNRIHLDIDWEEKGLSGIEKKTNIRIDNDEDEELEM